MNQSVFSEIFAFVYNYYKSNVILNQREVNIFAPIFMPCTMLLCILCQCVCVVHCKCLINKKQIVSLYFNFHILRGKQIRRYKIYNFARYAYDES